MYSGRSMPCLAWFAAASSHGRKRGHEPLAASRLACAALSRELARLALSGLANSKGASALGVQVPGREGCRTQRGGLVVAAKIAGGRARVRGRDERGLQPAGSTLCY